MLLNYQIGTIPIELDNANLTENADKLIIYSLNKQFVVHCLNSPLVQAQIKEATTKVGQSKLAIKRIESLIIPLPPLAEQHRIVAKILSCFPSVTSLKANRIKRLCNYDVSV